MRNAEILCTQRLYIIAGSTTSALHRYDGCGLDRGLQIRSGIKKNPNKEKKHLKATVMEHRDPLANMYLEHREELFSVFREPSCATE